MVMDNNTTIGLRYFLNRVFIYGKYKKKYEIKNPTFVRDGVGPTILSSEGSYIITFLFLKLQNMEDVLLIYQVELTHQISLYCLQPIVVGDLYNDLTE